MGHGRKGRREKPHSRNPGVDKSSKLRSASPLHYHQNPPLTQAVSGGPESSQEFFQDPSCENTSKISTTCLLSKVPPAMSNTHCKMREVWVFKKCGFAISTARPFRIYRLLAVLGVQHAHLLPSDLWFQGLWYVNFPSTSCRDLRNNSNFIIIFQDS